MEAKLIEIAGRKIGPDAPCFVIAEAGVNHNGSLDLARQLVAVAAQAGADAVKFQTFSAEGLVAPHAPKAQYQQAVSGAGESQQAMLKRLELSRAAHEALKTDCQTQGILFLSSPFEERSADFLDELGIAAFKLPSGEITNLPFLAHVARKGRPIILSTGMATLAEVETAVETIREAGNSNLILLHCVSRYPAEPQESNLRAMETMSRTFGLPVGFSDHTLGIEVSLAAVALGACVIEKHFTLDRSMPGPDHRASLEPEELAGLMQAIRKVQSALGDGVKAPVPGEAETARVARKSLFAATEIPAGAPLNLSMVAVKRPGDGLAPAILKELLGRPAKEAISSGAMLTREMFA